MPYTPKHYNQLMFFAYEIETSFVAQPVNPGPLPHMPIPNAGHLSADSLFRLNMLAHAVNETLLIAQANLHLTPDINDPNTLKVFMAPEFFFRPYNCDPIPAGITDVAHAENIYNTDATKTAYALQTSYNYSELANITATLKNIFSDPRFQDWIIVPGSIFSRIDTPSGYAYMNTTGIIKGGSTEAPSIFIHKCDISQLDGAPGRNAGIRDPDLGPILQTESIEKARVFSCDGLTFGIEVCLDHAMHRLQTVLNNWQGTRPAIDIQLLTACGMPINPAYAVVGQGGHVLRNDGQRNRIPKSEIQTKVLLIGNHAPTMVSTAAAGYFPLPFQIRNLPLQQVAYYATQRL